jgi:hypothetical protein
MKNGPIYNRDCNTTSWWCINQLHRTDGPAILNHGTGEQEWFLYGIRHREDGPAYISDNLVLWVQHNLLHRLDGPAYIATTIIGKREEYWIKGIQYSETEFNFWSKLTEENK